MRRLKFLKLLKLSMSLVSKASKTSPNYHVNTFLTVKIPYNKSVNSRKHQSSFQAQMISRRFLFVLLTLFLSLYLVCAHFFDRASFNLLLGFSWNWRRKNCSMRIPQHCSGKLHRLLQISAFGGLELAIWYMQDFWVRFWRGQVSSNNFLEVFVEAFSFL